MQTTLNKSYNYGILKPTIKVDYNRINMDYLAGIIYTDGSIRYEIEKQYYKITISQDNHDFLKKIYLFCKESNISSSFNNKHNQVYLYGKNIVKYFYNYSFIEAKDKASFLAGMIDGDGSFCSHKSKWGDYWRFQFGAFRTNEKKFIEKSLNWTNINYRKRKIKNGSMFEILSSKDILRLIELIKNKVLMKSKVIDFIHPKIKEFERNKLKECKYCAKKFYHKYSRDIKYCCCKSEKCLKERRKDYNKSRMKIGDYDKVSKWLGHSVGQTSQVYTQCRRINHIESIKKYNAIKCVIP